MRTLIQAAQSAPAPATPPATGLEQSIQELVDAAVRAAQERGAGSEEAALARERAADAMRELRAQMDAMRAEGRPVIAQAPFPFEPMIPPQAENMFYAFLFTIAFIAVGLPLARAFARRMDRRNIPASAADLAPRLDRIEQAVEAVAIEVERISENQRYSTKVISELRGLPSPVPDGWPGDATREPERVPRDAGSRP